MVVPLIRPDPPRLSEASLLLRRIEDRGIFTNFGPVNADLERDIVSHMFAGEGACLTVCNATTGLMLAVQQAIQDRPTRRRYALMPSFTFAAAAQAAMWCGLTPLLYDIDPNHWAACAAEEEALLARYGDDVAVLMPYATFGYDIDLARYESLKARYHVPVVVDAAGSLGTVSADGRGFGAGFSITLVFSMHATKSFATGEGGIIYSADKAVIRELRQMANFGFGRSRTATMPGLNAKLTEIGALLAQLRLEDYEEITQYRADLMQCYRHALPELTFQAEQSGRQAHQIIPALLPRTLAGQRAVIGAALAADGIGNACYFSPHLAQQDYFIKHAVYGDLPVTDDVASRMISLPLFDTMTEQDIFEVANALRRHLAGANPALPQRRRRQTDAADRLLVQHEDPMQAAAYE